MNRNSFTSSCSIWTIFISLSCLIVLLEPLVQCWTEVMIVDIFVWFLILEEKHPFFFLTLNMMLWVLHISHLSDWGSSLLFLIRFFFNHESMLDFVKCIFCAYWDDHVVLFFISFIWCIPWTNFQMLSQSCIPGVNTIWFWFIHCNFFYKLLDLIC